MSSRLIKINTNKDKFIKQYLTLMNPILLKEGLTKQEIDVFCLLLKHSEEGKVTKSGQEVVKSDLKLKDTELKKVLVALRKKKVINRQSINTKLVPVFDKEFKLMFYFYE